jgi:putative DNA primase/helicase
LHILATEAEQALLAADVPLYSRGGELVRPIVESVRALRGGTTNVTRLRPVNVSMLCDYLSRSALWKKEGKKGIWIPIDPPSNLAQIILSRDGEWKFRRLTGIITTPTMRPDSSILCVPGHDQATGLLLVSPPPMPSIPEKPSRDDALTALAMLKALLVEFPFLTDADRSVALSALMTPIVRGAMPVVPLHAFTAPEAGTGKSYIVDLSSAIATGEVSPAMAAGRDEAETETRLGAELISGQPIISIDNLNGDLSGDFLCQAIERPILKPRILGKSETVRIENTVTMYGNGNNIKLVGDVCRRVVLCSLDANVERPELRKFKHDPLGMILAERGRYITAILSIVKIAQQPASSTIQQSIECGRLRCRS